jgi:hypothetical protein
MQGPTHNSAHKQSPFENVARKQVQRDAKQPAAPQHLIAAQVWLTHARGKSDASSSTVIWGRGPDVKLIFWHYCGGISAVADDPGFALMLNLSDDQIDGYYEQVADDSGSHA